MSMGLTKLPHGAVLLSCGVMLMEKGYSLNSPDILESAVYDAPNRMRVIASIDRTNGYGILRHVSVSYPDKDPSWEEIKAVRDAFFPKHIDCMMVLPRAEDYVNVHPHAFHIWETPTRWGMR